MELQKDQAEMKKLQDKINELESKIGQATKAEMKKLQDKIQKIKKWKSTKYR